MTVWSQPRVDMAQGLDAKPQRNGSIPDYYTLLGLDLRADASAVEQALARCQSQWSSGTRNPKTRHTFQSYLEQVPQIRQALLAGSDARARYDAELAASRRSERDALMGQLRRKVRLRAAKGGLAPADRALLSREALRLGLTQSDLDELTLGLPSLPDDPAARDDGDDGPAREALDPSAQWQIRITLEHLAKRDLYHALDVPRDASGAVIASRADAERKRWMHKTQVTAEKTAWLEAITYAQSHLLNPESRRRYDRTLDLEAEEAFLGVLRFTLEGLTALDEATARILIEEALSLGVAATRAERLMARQCRVAGVVRTAAVPLSPSAPFAIDAGPRAVRCRSCGRGVDLDQAIKRGDPSKAACPSCKASLRWSCPNCGQGRWIDEAACGCGFAQGAIEAVEQGLEAAEHAFKARDYATALDRLMQVQALAPRHPEGRRAERRVRQRLAEISRLRAEYDLERSRDALVAAREVLREWSKLVEPLNPEVEAAMDGLNRELRKALALAARARNSLPGDPSGAADLLRQSLAIASDLPEAREALRRVPPPSPRDLVVEFKGESLVLHWTAPAPDGLGPLQFRAVRKRGGLPASSVDGHIIALTGESEVIDPHPPSGESVGYAVFGHRGEAESAAGAFAGPFLIMLDASDVKVETLAGEVHLSWTPPQGSIGVRVQRKEGVPPSGPTDGTTVEAIRDRAIDAGLNPDRTYHYGIYALYPGGAGKVRAARGVFVSAWPQAAQDAVRELTAHAEPDGRVRLTWPPPARGQVRIVRTDKPIGRARGEPLSLAEAKAIPGIWLATDQEGAAHDPAPPSHGACHYTALNYWSGVFAVGPEVAYARLPDPADLRAARPAPGGKVQLRWKWNAPGADTLVLLKPGGPPAGPDDPQAVVALVTELDYLRQGFHAVPLPTGPSAPWHARVYHVSKVDGERIVSPGADPSARAEVPPPGPDITLRYELKRRRWPGTGWRLTLITEPPDAPLPPTALVANLRRPPVAADDGILVDRFPAAHGGEVFLIRTDLDLGRHHLRLFPDPLADPSGLIHVQIRHPDARHGR
jgi:hypothetical protein